MGRSDTGNVVWKKKTVLSVFEKKVIHLCYEFTKFSLVCKLKNL